MTRNPRTVPAAALLAATLLSTCNAAGLLVADGGSGGVLEILDHEVHVTLTGAVAVTEVTQVFLNTENRQLEALYTFPVPRGASVSGFTMWIEGREMVGEVLEKERAREIYESYKRQGVDPGLLEQVDFRTFEMRVFPIAPGAEQRVRITYYQELDIDHDRATYVYPLATATRSGVDTLARRKLSFDLDAVSPVPLISLSSPSHGEDFLVVKRSDGYYQASLETSSGDLGRDFVLSYQTERPRTGLDVLATRPAGEDGYFMLTLTAGPELAAARGGADFVFVLDISGSMRDDGKFDLSRRCLAAFTGALRPEDRFDLITFNVEQKRALGQLTAPSEEALASVVKFVGTSRVRGGTELRPALALAYEYGRPDRTLNVVVLSDGITSQWNRKSIHQLIEGAAGDSRIFCVGVGNDTDRGLLTQIAQDAGGLAAFLSTSDDLERQAEAFRRKLVHPAASDVRLTFEGGQVHDLEPLDAPDLFHGSPIRVYGRCGGSGTTTITARATVDGEEVSWQHKLDLGKVSDEFPELERMWAWKRMDRLMAQGDRRGDRAAVRDEIVALGEGYSIASEFTSFLVLENDDEYRRWKIERRNASRVQRDQRRLGALREQLQGLRDQSQARLAPLVPEDELTAAATPRTTNTTPAPAAAPADRPAAAAPRAEPDPARSARPARGRPFDWNVGGSSGGGALDPICGGLALGAAAALLAARRRREDETDLDGDDAAADAVHNSRS